MVVSGVGLHKKICPKLQPYLTLWQMVRVSTAQGDVVANVNTIHISVCTLLNTDSDHNLVVNRPLL